MSRWIMRGAAGILGAILAVAVVQPSASAAEGGIVAANAQSAYQTNAPVWTMAYAHNAVYIAGDFTTVRPPGAAAGTNETARNHMAAFSSQNGALLPFSHTFNVRPSVIAASPDGSRIYAGGNFTVVDGAAHTRLVAFDTSTGALVPTFNPKPTATVNAIAVSADSNTVFFGGGFGKVGTTPRSHLAAVNATTGALLPWAPVADNITNSMAISPDGTGLFLAGYFTQLNGDSTYRSVGELSTTTGATIPFPAASAMPPVTSSCSSIAKDVVVSGGTAYFAAEGTGGGCFDGTFAANVSDGSLLWQNKCLGATQAIQVVGGWLYKGSHAHDCATQDPNDPDAFPQVPESGARHLLSERLDNGNLGPFYANTNGGPNNGLGPRAMATDGTSLWVGGQFTTVNNKPQAYFAKFSPTPDTTVPGRPLAPAGVSSTPGSVNVYVQAPVDIESPDIVVRLYRDNGTTPISTSDVVHSLFWRQPVVSFVDSGLVPGSVHTYRADAVEAPHAGANPTAGVRSAPSAAVKVSSSAASYANAVNSDSPTFFWRLGEPSGPIAADSSASRQAGLYSSSGVTYGQPGAIVGDSDTAVAVDGNTGNVDSGNPMQSPGVFSAEAWFKTTTTAGGKIIGFGNSQSGSSSNYDKHVYMTNSGQLDFGTYNGGTVVVTSPASYNNGHWHQVVATQGPSGMQLYVDGNVVASNSVTTNQSYNGYWRVGGDNLNGWPSQPSSSYFAGSIDEVAVYPVALSAARVAAHYNASGEGSVG